MQTPDTLTPAISPQVSQGYGLCVAELEKWQSAIQRDANVCSQARKQHMKTPTAAAASRLSMIDPNGHVRDSVSLNIALVESSAKYFKEMERRNSKPRSNAGALLRGRGTTVSGVVSQKDEMEQDLTRTK